MKYLTILVAVLLGACGKSTPPPQTPAAKAPFAVTRSSLPASAPVNPDFEQPATESEIPGWTQTQHAGAKSYSMTVDAQGAYAGQGSFHMKRTQAQVFGTLQQFLDARPYAGKTVELSAMLKAHGVGAHGWKLIVSAELPGAMAYSKGLTGDADWTRDSVRLKVPARATELMIGVTLLDAGEGWMDDVALKPVD